MLNQVKAALVLLIAVIAVLTVVAGLTDAMPALSKANIIFFILSSLIFIASILLWLLAWALLLRNKKTGLCHTMLIGLGCVFAALTPVQVGADALRSLKMKEKASIPYSESIGASMILKGLKFLIISLVAAFAFSVAFLSPSLGLWVKAALVSGFAVVVLAALLFLLPLNAAIGTKISLLFRALSGATGFSKRLSDYFLKYSAYLGKMPKKTLALVSLLSLASLCLELAAFFTAFLSAGIMVPFYSVLTIFSILAILERTPFLPRGIGVVEAAAFILLSLQGFVGAELNAGSIASVIIIFDVVRLVIPTLLSLLVYVLLSSEERIRAGTQAKTLPEATSRPRWKF